MASDAVTNLRVLKRSRRRPSAGDVFAMQLPDDAYLFGRVIGADLDHPRAPMPGAYLIYVYRHRSTSKVPDWAALQADRLLVGSSRVDLQACKLEYSIVSPK